MNENENELVLLKHWIWDDSQNGHWNFRGPIEKWAAEMMIEENIVFYGKIVPAKANGLKVTGVNCEGSLSS